MSEAKNAPFRWCFIGAGHLAEKVAKELAAGGNHQIAAVYTRRYEAAKRFTDRFGGVPCATPEEAISQRDVDGVYVVTPHSSHAHYAALALRIGKPVLLEKPFTLEPESARVLVALAREKQIYLAEAMWTWFSPVAQQVKRWVDAGELGKPETAELSYCFWKPRYPADRLFDPKRGGGALMDIGIYPVTYLYRLFGTPETITCTGTVDGGIDLEEEIAMTFSNGLRAHLLVSLRRLPQEELRIDGEKASIRGRLYHCGGTIKLLRRAGTRETARGDGGYRNEFDRVAEEIRAGRTESAFVPLEDTLAVLELLEECKRQLGLDYGRAALL